MSDDVSNREFGRIIHWSNNYGFIRPDQGERDVFVHRSEFEGEPRVGDRVTYEMGADRRPGREPNRICAVQVRFEGDTTKPGMFAAPTYGDDL
jgi:cold shock CspA family protein